MSLYLALDHGRAAPENISDWGFYGPIFQIDPGRVRMHYADRITLGCERVLYLVNDMLYYDGAYYGSWSIAEYTEFLNMLETRHRAMVDFDQAKALPPTGWGSRLVRERERLNQAQAAADAEKYLTSLVPNPNHTRPLRLRKS